MHDVAEAICRTAEEMHKRDIESRKVEFCLHGNSQYSMPYRFFILNDAKKGNKLFYNDCELSLTKKHMFAVFNQALKYYIRDNLQNVSWVYIAIRKSSGELFSTRTIRRISPCVRIEDLYKYDVDNDNEALNTAYNHLWKFVKRFQSLKTI